MKDKAGWTGWVGIISQVQHWYTRPQEIRDSCYNWFKDRSLVGAMTAILVAEDRGGKQRIWENMK